jgi:hypothetical protein
MSFNDDFLASLTPAELQMLMGYNDSGYEDFGDYGDTGGGSAFNFSYDGGGSMVQPTVGQYTTKGEINPMSRTEEAGRVNLLQDYGALSVDNILTGYGGAGSYDIGAFTPTYDYGEPLNLSGRRKAESLAGTGGWQGFVTDLILNEGMSPAEAESMLYKVIEAPDDPSLSETERAQKLALTDSMKPLMAADTGAPTSLGGRNTGQSAATTEPYDAVPIREFTTRVWSDLMEDPEFKYQDPETGLYYDKTPEEAIVKTPQMMAYDKFGIPYPVENYEDPKWIDAMAGSTEDERQAQMEPFQAGLDEISGRRQEAVGGMGRSRDALRGLERGAAEGVAPTAAPITEIMRQWAGRSGGDESAAPTSGGPPPPDRDTFYDQAIDRANRNRASQGLPAIDANPGGWQSSSNSTDRQGSLDAARAAADADYQIAFEKWQKEKEDGQGSSFDFGGQEAAAPSTERLQPFTFMNKEGNRSLYEGDLSTARGSDIPIPSLGGWGGGFVSKAPIGRPQLERLTPQMIDEERGRGRTANKQRYAAEKEFQQAQTRDPRIAQAAAIGRALALSRMGRTPFQDAMESRNTNSRRMLIG